MKTAQIKWALVAAMALTATSGFAQESKVGYINTQRITTESAPAKAAQAKLEAEFSKRQKDLADVQQSLKAMSEKFERDAPAMSEAQRTTRQKEFAEQNRDFQRKQREFQEDLNLRKNEELQQVLERANRVIRQVAETEKYDLIIQEAVYINPKHDITDKVLSGLNNAK